MSRFTKMLKVRLLLVISVAALLGFPLNGCKKSNLASSSKINPSAVELAPIRGFEIAELAKKSKEPLTVVNLWASWCYPCRVEFPELVNFYKKWQGKGVDLKFVSMDFGDQKDVAREFLSSQGVDFVTYIKDENDTDFIRNMDPSWQGLLPTTYLYDRSGKILARLDEALTTEELERKIKKLKK